MRWTDAFGAERENIMGMVCSLLSVEPKTLEFYKNNVNIMHEEFDKTYRSNDRDISLTLDKAWQGIHFLLCNNPWNGDPPESLVILGGTEIGADEYGPATYLTENQVAETHKYLQTIDYANLRRKYFPENFEEEAIYPQNMWKEDGIKAYEYLEEVLKEVNAFYKNSYTKKRCVIKWLSF